MPARTRPIFWSCLIAGSTVIAATFLATPSGAQLSAHLHVWDITDIGAVDTTDADLEDAQEGWFDAEPFWVAAIFQDGDGDLASSQWVDPACAEWAATSTLSVGTEFSAAIPDLSEARFHLSVFDYDTYPTVPSGPSWYAELIGDHEWTGARDVSSPSPPEPNLNNGLAYQTGEPGAAICGSDQPRGLGSASNFAARFRSWHEDATPPVPASSLMHEGPRPDLNEDGTLSFVWTPGSDQHSGTLQQLVLERLSDASACSVSLATSSQDRFAMQTETSCQPGSDVPTLSLETGESYRARVETRNGTTPSIDNPVWAASNTTGWVLHAGLPPGVPVLTGLARIVLVTMLCGTALRTRRARGVGGASDT